MAFKLLESAFISFQNVNYTN